MRDDGYIEHYRQPGHPTDGRQPACGHRRGGGGGGNNGSGGIGGNGGSGIVIVSY